MSYIVDFETIILDIPLSNNTISLDNQKKITLSQGIYRLDVKLQILNNDVQPTDISLCIVDSEGHRLNWIG
jgi:hypothetical protein